MKGGLGGKVGRVWSCSVSLPSSLLIWVISTGVQTEHGWLGTRHREGGFREGSHRRLRFFLFFCLSLLAKDTHKAFAFFFSTKRALFYFSLLSCLFFSLLPIVCVLCLARREVHLSYLMRTLMIYFVRAT